MLKKKQFDELMQFFNSYNIVIVDLRRTGSIDLSDCEITEDWLEDMLVGEKK